MAAVIAGLGPLVKAVTTGCAELALKGHCAGGRMRTVTNAGETTNRGGKRQQILLGVAAVLGAYLIWTMLQPVFDRPLISTPISTKVLETHNFPGRPTVEVVMHGFADMSFDAHLLDGSARSKIFEQLPCLKSSFDWKMNPIERPYLGHPTLTDHRNHPQYTVHWSGDTNRVAMAFMGFLIAGYDLTTKQVLQLPGGIHTDYAGYDARIAQFLMEGNTGPTAKYQTK